MKRGARDPSLDFIRALMILIVCLGHALTGRPADDPAAFVLRALSPGMTMSLIACLSAMLVAPGFAQGGAGSRFLVRRLLRLFVPMWLCLLPIIAWHLASGLKPLTQHGLLHLLGLTAFIELSGAVNTSSIGAALWFVTAIMVMYFLLPLLRALYEHRYRNLHLAALMVIGVAASALIYGAQSFWNVFIGFTLGAFASWRRGESAPPALPLGLPWLALGSLVVIGLRVVSMRSGRGWISDLILPLYPIFVLPCLLWLGARLPAVVLGVCSFFAALSFEFYMLHPYFIHDGFARLFGSWSGLWWEVLASLLLALLAAALLHPLAENLRSRAERYLALR